VACVFGHFCTLKLKKSRNSASGGDALIGSLGLEFSDCFCCFYLTFTVIVYK
jgi:hypothetical protein